jgi:hypothetical protein
MSVPDIKNVAEATASEPHEVKFMTQRSPAKEQFKPFCILKRSGGR